MPWVFLGPGGWLEVAGLVAIWCLFYWRIRMLVRYNQEQRDRELRRWLQEPR